MNDEYARDISNKVRSVLDNKKNNGQFIGSVAPFGYKKDPNNKHKFIIYKKAAIDDLLNTENYIINQFHNDQAAKKLKNNIVDTISLLKDNPYLGPKMSDRFDIDTPFRYLIVSKQLVFYNVNEENVEIIRTLDSRQDYLSLLF